MREGLSGNLTKRMVALAQAKYMNTNVDMQKKGWKRWSELE